MQMLVIRITSVVLLNVSVKTIHSSRDENVAFKNKIIVLVKGTSQKWLVIGSNLQFPELNLEHNCNGISTMSKLPITINGN